MYNFRFDADSSRLVGRDQVSLDGCTAVIGNFDGVHRGHRHILRQAGAGAVAVITFAPHPRLFFGKVTGDFLLSTPKQKARWLKAAVPARPVVTLAFDQALASLPAEEFCALVLKSGLGVRRVLVGEDFRFGRNRQGDVAAFVSSGIAAESLPLLAHDSAGLTSSRIRRQLREGAIEAATAALGRFFEIEATVIEGRKLGRRLQFPTANLRIGQYVQPRFGIYAVLAASSRQSWQAVASFGIRPTVADTGAEPLLEVYLFDHSLEPEALYGQKLSVRFVSFLRDEQKFPDLDSLKIQMQRDCRRAKEALGRHDIFSPV